MGVHGLWKLIEPSGQMVPLESLAGKVLAVDISIWLHQAVKGMHDAHGAPVAVAHLLILFHRLCKLLFYKIKPVFVFDGGVPLLKSQTMAARRQRSTAAKSEALKVREKLIKNLLKHEAVRQVLSNETASAALGLNSFTLPGPSVEEDLYKLPPIAADYDDSEGSDGATSSEGEGEKAAEDIHSIDVTSQEFLSLPAEVRHDILTELIETRKQSSWKNLDSMPKQSDNFSDFQMSRLLKRHAVQTSLEKAGKEMGGRALSMKELESLLGDQGVLDPKTDVPSRRIAQDNTTRYMLVQRDSETTPGKFDVMEHLEDVDWSSDSDTDIILEKRKRRDVTGECGSHEEKEGSRPETGEVRATEEVADILSILEDKDTTADVKVKAESPRSEINLNTVSNDVESVESVPGSDENVLSTASSSVYVKEHPVSPAPEPPDKSQIQVVEVPTNDSENQNVPELVKENCEEMATINGKELESTVERSSGTEVSVAEDEKTRESSSDSESDFIPITPAKMESVLPPTRETEENAPPPPKEPKTEGDSLTVVINPSELSRKDDLFADVFEPVEDGDSADTQTEGRQNEDTDEKKTGLGGRVTAEELSKALQEEQSLLVKEKGRQERHALNLTDQIYTDAQELLRLFGVPYVVAPMEAEAQCAMLNVIGLTEGTITDDSDIWLFGGRVVYKNFFNQNKHVLEYRSENIERNFKLTREEMIKMALLVGSDYTVGLSGIGPVTALEIIASFQTPNRGALESLVKFREWFMGTAKGDPPRATLRKKIRNAVMTPGFPSRAVVEAYLHPRVDDSKEPFSWAKPNLDLIHKYVRAKMGWSTEKCNDLLLPVLKKLEEKSGQTTIDKHFKIVQKPASTEGMLSKRVENAIKRLGNSSIESDEPVEDPKPRKKRKPNTGTRTDMPAPGEDADAAKRPKGSEAKTSFPMDDATKLKLIKDKLHRNIKVPQREMAQKMLEEKKKEAIKIFRTYGKAGKKKTKVFAKEEANLSESSSESD